jgi:hypothetical protein
MPGYPVLPAAFVLVAAGIVYSVIRADPARAAIGVGLLAVGGVGYWAFQVRKVR